MWNPFAKKKQKEIIAPAAGKIVHLEEVPDEAFSGGGMGTGFGIDFHGKNVYAPADGTVEVCFPTGHALGLTCEMGEIILHIGIDTVELNGDGFHACVKQGQTVKKGDLLVEVDSDVIWEKGYNPILVFLFPNGEAVPALEYGKTVSEKEVIAKC